MKNNYVPHSLILIVGIAQIARKISDYYTAENRWRKFNTGVYLRLQDRPTGSIEKKRIFQNRIKNAPLVGSSFIDRRRWPSDCGGAWRARARPDDRERFASVYRILSHRHSRRSPPSPPSPPPLVFKFKFTYNKPFVRQMYLQMTHEH